MIYRDYIVMGSFKGKEKRQLMSLGAKVQRGDF